MLVLYTLLYTTVMLLYVCKTVKVLLSVFQDFHEYFTIQYYENLNNSDPVASLRSFNSDTNPT